MRITGARLAYSLAVWVFGPGIRLSMLVAVGGSSNLLALGSVDNLIGRLLYRVLLGALVSVFTDMETEAHESEAPFEEASEESRGRQT